ncbi:acyl-CoA thioesterase domain-containing protein [Mycolicibacterium sp.]|uniref:acyl-CoA thioesterase domain-containing protein n=1 Tax=Mycolicibacterium sp. TaxID=2320850 RepID=UPI001A19C9C3|nr:acyl-CoA thioesterase domain-containing protein [Mycolicibacterium sp.]MBJ7338248.1 thioesterase family protein [Mycolicibacterium sp.]
MTAPSAHFVPTAADTFLPTSNALSRWGADQLNGPALVGLAARTLEERFGLDEFMPVRLTVDLFKAARRMPTTATVRLIRDGRRVRNSECELLQDGVAVAKATMVQYRRSSAPRGEEWSATMDLPLPTDVDDDSSFLRVGSDDGGWSPNISDHRNTSRKRFLNRAIDVIEGSANSPFVNAVYAAEGTSLVANLGTAGIGYINGDLTVALARLPVDEWICVQADSHWVADGVSTGASTLYDRNGAFGTGVITAISNPGAQIEFADDASVANSL